MRKALREYRINHAHVESDCGCDDANSGCSDNNCSSSTEDCGCADEDCSSKQNDCDCSRDQTGCGCDDGQRTGSRFKSRSPNSEKTAYKSYYGKLLTEELRVSRNFFLDSNYNINLKIDSFRRESNLIKQKPQPSNKLTLIDFPINKSIKSTRLTENSEILGSVLNLSYKYKIPDGEEIKWNIIDKSSKEYLTTGKFSGNQILLFNGSFSLEFPGRVSLTPIPWGKNCFPCNQIGCCGNSAWGYPYCVNGCCMVKNFWCAIHDSYCESLKCLDPVLCKPPCILNGWL